MIGNERIAKILIEDYNVGNIELFDDISYEITELDDNVSRVKITSNNQIKFCCPIYAMFDHNYMMWYGDYGEFVFNCTWDTNVNNLPYESPYYQLEKLKVPKKTKFNSYKCRNEILDTLHNSLFYKEDLNETQRMELNEFLNDDWADIIYYDSPLYVYEDECETLKNILSHTYDEFDWFGAISNISEEDLNHIFDCEYCEMYDWGQEPPANYFIILYMLSVVAAKESEKKANERAK